MILGSSSQIQLHLSMVEGSLKYFCIFLPGPLVQYMNNLLMIFSSRDRILLQLPMVENSDSGFVILARAVIEMDKQFTHDPKFAGSYLFTTGTRPERESEKGFSIWARSHWNHLRTIYS
jgi:hypothetical protein